MTHAREIYTQTRLVAAFLLDEVTRRTNNNFLFLPASITTEELDDAVKKSLEHLDSELNIEEFYTEVLPLVAAKDAVIIALREKAEIFRNTSPIKEFLIDNFLDGYLKTVNEALWERIDTVKPLLG